MCAVLACLLRAVLHVVRCAGMLVVGCALAVLCIVLTRCCVLCSRVCAVLVCLLWAVLGAVLCWRDG